MNRLCSSLSGLCFNTLLVKSDNLFNWSGKKIPSHPNIKFHFAKNIIHLKCAFISVLLFNRLMKKVLHHPNLNSYPKHSSLYSTSVLPQILFYLFSLQMTRLLPLKLYFFLYIPLIHLVEPQMTHQIFLFFCPVLVTDLKLSETPSMSKSNWIWIVFRLSLP